MKPKKQSGLYTFLVFEGVLEFGSANDIREAKKQYWKQVRKEWRKQQRKEQKSYTVFFTDEEQKQVKVIADKRTESITRFIKNAALQSVHEGGGVDKITIGKIRQAFFICYKSIGECNTIELVLQKINELEKNVMKLIQ
jgi:hypothetical protein